MRYTNIGSEMIGATRFFSPPVTHSCRTAAKDTMDQKHAEARFRESNPSTTAFVITIDPQQLYTLGVSTFTLVDVTLGIRSGAFSEGTEFISPTGRVRIIRGKLRYTRNKALYNLPEMRV